MTQNLKKEKNNQNNSQITLTLDLRIYDKAAIYSACYGILDIAYISLELSNSKTPYILTIHITPKQSTYNSEIITNTIQEQALCIMFIRNRKQQKYGSENIILKRFIHWMEDSEQLEKKGHHYE